MSKFKVNDAVMVDRGAILDAKLCRVVAVTDLGCPVVIISNEHQIIPPSRVHRVGHYVKRWWRWHLVHLDEELLESANITTTPLSR